MRATFILLNVFILFASGCNRITYINNTGAKDYTTIFNEAISHSNYVIIKPGLYLLKAPIYLHSNLVIQGEGEVILKKDKLYPYVFANQKAINNFSAKWDTSVSIMNIVIDANHKGKQNDTVNVTANGQLSFQFLKNLILKNIKIINGDPIMYGVHLQSVIQARVINYSYDGDKDGIHINGGCKGINIDGFDISSYDDAFGIMTDDYPRIQNNTQDIRNIVIKNGVSRKRYPQAGFFLRLMTGSWDDWSKGNKYNIGNTVNCQGRQYKKLNKGEMVSWEYPSHLKGDSLYPDGIIWRYLGNGTNKTSNIYNLSVFNVTLDDGRNIVRTINADSNDYGEYPGTENKSIVDSVYIEGHQLKTTRGKVGFWKTTPKRDYIALCLFILSIIGIIIIAIFLLRSRNQIK